MTIFGTATLEILEPFGYLLVGMLLVTRLLNILLSWVAKRMNIPEVRDLAKAYADSIKIKNAREQLALQKEGGIPLPQLEDK